MEDDKLTNTINTLSKVRSIKKDIKPLCKGDFDKSGSYFDYLNEYDSFKQVIYSDQYIITTIYDGWVSELKRHTSDTESIIGHSLTQMKSYFEDIKYKLDDLKKHYIKKDRSSLFDADQDFIYALRKAYGHLEKVLMDRNVVDKMVDSKTVRKRLPFVYYP